jgi:hypothetical protein
LTSDQAVTAALRHGLTVHDALSIKALAEDEASADKIARQFARGGSGQFVRDLFGGRPEPDAADEPTEAAKSAHVPGEPKSASIAGDDDRQFARDFFGS